MDTILVEIREDEVDSSAAADKFKQAGEILNNGGLVAFPTETVYGLGGNALDPDASGKIYRAKGRPSDNPLIVHVSDSRDVQAIVDEIPPKGQILMDRFWPGPLTLVFNKNEKVPYETTGGLDTVAIRNPSNKVARELFKYSSGYIAAPSANLSGHPSPTTAEHVVNDLSGLIDMIIDGGDADCGLESTIVDVTVDPPMILRPGFVTLDMLQEAVGEVDIDRSIIDPNSGIRPKAPGMKYRHYAPRAEMIVVEGPTEYTRNKIKELVKKDTDQGLKVGVIIMDDESNAGEWGQDLFASNITYIGSKNNTSMVGKRLYGVLREYDKMDIDRIYSEAVDDIGVGAAVMNRLLKAAGHQVIKPERKEQ